MMKMINLVVFMLASVVSIFDGGVMLAAIVDGTEGVGRHIQGQVKEGEPVTTGVLRGQVEPGTENDDNDFVVDDIDKEILKIKHSATPIDQITRSGRKVKCESMEYEYYSIDEREMMATVTTATVSADPVTGGDMVSIVTSNNQVFDETDQIMVCGVAGWLPNADGVTGDYHADANVYCLSVYVREINKNNGSLVCVPINGAIKGKGRECPAIPAGSVLIRIGHAACEGDAQTAPYGALPTKERQYNQIFMAQNLESTLASEANTEVRWTPSDRDELIVAELRKEVEMAYLFGRRGKTWNSVKNCFVYTTSGVIEQIVNKGQVITYDKDALDDAGVVDITKDIFVGNSGSASRLILAGANFIANVSKLPGIQRQIDATETERVFGFTWRKWVTNFGTLNLLMHPLFNEVDSFSDCAVVIDPQYLTKRVYRDMRRTVLDLIHAGIYDGRSNVLQEISSVLLKYGKCHALIVPEV